MDYELYPDPDEYIRFDECDECYECTKCGPNISCIMFKETGYDCNGYNLDGKMSPTTKTKFKNINEFLCFHEHGRIGPCKCKNINPECHCCGIIKINGLNKKPPLIIILAEYIEKLEESKKQGNKYVSQVLNNSYRIYPQNEFENRLELFS